MAMSRISRTAFASAMESSLIQRSRNNSRILAHFSLACAGFEKPNRGRGAIQPLRQRHIPGMRGDVPEIVEQVSDSRFVVA
jgi:hypothetical protein